MELSVFLFRFKDPKEMSAEGVSIAKQVLELQTSNDPFAVLSLAPGMPPVTKETDVGTARRNYMKLATLIHPDKILKTFDKATESFQCLVKMFELLASPQFRKLLEKRGGRQAAAKKTPSTAPEKAAKPARKVQRKENRDEDGAESSTSDEDDDKPLVTLIAKKTPASTAQSKHERPPGAKIMRATVRCPNCKTKWEPDGRQHYPLFMHYGLKVHCSLCLFRFGCATAIQECPGCRTEITDYDATKYDAEQDCKRCSIRYYFATAPFTQAHLDSIAQEAKEEERARQLALEREERAAHRGKGAHSDEDKKLELIGQCTVDEKCPICRKNVFSKHRAHVENCMANPPPPPARAPRVVIIGERKPRAKKAAPKKRGRDYNSDSDD